MKQVLPTRRDSLPDRMADFAARWGTWLIVALVPFSAYMRLYTPVRSQMYFFKLATLALVSVVLAFRMFGRRPMPKIDIPWIAAMLLAGATIVSSGLSSEPGFALNASLPILCGLALFLTLRSGFAGRNMLTWFAPVFAVQAVILCGYGFGQYFDIDWLQWLPYYQMKQKSAIMATFGHPNFYGSYMGPVMFICLAWAATPGSLARRASALAIALVVAVTLILARSRAVWIGCALGFGAMFLLVFARPLAERLRPRSLSGAFRGAVALGALALMTVLALGPQRLADGASWMVRKSNPGARWDTRVYYWYTAAGMHGSLDPIGIGRGGFSRRFWPDVDAQQLARKAPLFRRNVSAMTGVELSLDPGNVHNDYLELWAETGWAGLAGHLLLVGYLIYFVVARIRRLPRAGPAAWAGKLVPAALLAGFICQLFDGMLGFPLALPCSLPLFYCYGAMLNQVIEAEAA